MRYKASQSLLYREIINKKCVGIYSLKEGKFENFSCLHNKNAFVSFYIVIILKEFKLWTVSIFPEFRICNTLFI
jgi:hypothetical protein